MSAVAATEGLFFSALQPNTSVTTYAIPTEDHRRRDQLSKVRRVQQQVQQRMAEKSASSSRLNASAGEDSTCWCSAASVMNSSVIILKSDSNMNTSLGTLLNIDSIIRLFLIVVRLIRNIVHLPKQ